MHVFVMTSKSFFVILFINLATYEILGDTINYGVPQAFPICWNGDAYNQTNCDTVMSIPSFLDGYFFIQTTASYGDQSSPDGQKLLNLLEGISAVSMFDLNPVQSTFSAAYYPTISYKIWDLYSRDMSKSTVAWDTFFSPWNNSQKVFFEDRVQATMNYEGGQPNVDFWKIGSSIVAGTEGYELGLTFDIPTLTSFVPYPFIDNNTYFNESLSTGPETYIALHMPIHERVDLETGLLWNSVFTMGNTKSGYDFHELIFTVDPQGYRNIIADYPYTSFDQNKCNWQTGVYTGDWTNMPGYMHSTTSTKNFFILPLTSNLFNPCLFSPLKPNPGDANVIWNPRPPNTNWIPYKYNSEVKLRFLLFDKRDHTFKMIVHDYAQFVTHQINAYEVNETTIYVDMLTYDDNIYDGLSPKEMSNLTSQDFSKFPAYLYRFTLDLHSNKSTNISLLPEYPLPLEFTQFNHHYEGLKYQWGYALYGGYAKNSSIWKIDVNDHSGANNKIFYEGFDISFGEPNFVARPDATSEDDGVLVIRALDVSINKTRVYVVDALTMTKISEIVAPDMVPFGFHNRYFSKESLGLPSTPTLAPPTSTPTTPKSNAVVITRNFGTLLFAILILAYIKLI